MNEEEKKKSVTDLKAIEKAEAKRARKIAKRLADFQKEQTSKSKA